MMRSASGRVRFYRKGEGQVGAEHPSIVAAAHWAWANGWLWAEDDGTVDFATQLRCRQWTLAGGAQEVAS
jgi:hypothetical protein